ncbi:hypothetical protein SBRY_40119 [Actinacidiphila bryophytorum]|uniref:Uncharacterized protein n=1 Tax=Actinacidiphila bryophytorum TaxID=1436133 RepID=A0A9W4H2G8_9ACTN|nr:hypothetical protein SBRY_40119 [Actinacidiphila bryophytorum]
MSGRMDQEVALLEESARHQPRRQPRSVQRGDGEDELCEFAVPHLQSGRLALDETVVDGFEHIVDAFLGMLHGGNTGKMIVRDRAEAWSGRGKHSRGSARGAEVRA